MMDRMLAVQSPIAETGVTLGSWPDWIAAIGTTLAFLIAAVTYFRSSRSAIEAQARLVYATLDTVDFLAAGETFSMLDGGATMGFGEGFAMQPSARGVMPRTVALEPVMRVSVRLRNGSAEVIGPAKVQLWNIGRKFLLDRVAANTGPIEPHSDLVISIVVANPDHPAMPSVRPVLIYRDSSARWWKRDGFEPIERIHDDPHNMAETSAQRASRADVAKRLGLGELEPLPRVPLSARWHRLWRRVRGKSALP